MSSIPCPEQDETGWIRELANRLAQSGLTAPAVALLEICRPLAFVGSQFLLALDPLLALFEGRVSRRYVQLFENPQHLDALLEMLENQQRDPEA